MSALTDGMSVDFVPYEVVHRVPGRIRLRIPRLKKEPAFAERYAQFVAAQPGVKSVRVNRACASAVVEYDLQLLPPSEVAAALTALSVRGFSAPDAHVQAFQPRALWRALVTPALAFAFAAFGAPPGIVIAGLAAAAVPVVRRAAKALVMERRLTVDSLDAGAVTVMLGQGNVAAAAGLLLLVALGESIRERTARSSRLEMAALLASLRRQTWVVREGRVVAVPADRVIAGERVEVHPGELILVDGPVHSGIALVDQSTLTGEATPVRRTLGDTVYAGTLVREGALQVTAERVGAATRASQIIQLQAAAPVQDTRAANYAARFADRLVAPTFALAAVTGALSGNAGRSASILITDYATGIRVSTPTAVLAAMRQAARSGVVLRSGRALEQLAIIDTVVFDKTGTLTVGRPTIRSVRVLERAWSQEDVLAWAASAERGIQHPAAAALRGAAAQRGLSLLPAEDWRYHMGLGVAARVEGRDVLLGSARLLADYGIDVHDPDDASDAVSTVYLAVDGRPVGAISSEDPIRPEAQAVIRALRGRGVQRILLLTGDRQVVADHAGRRVGVDTVIAEQFPEQKAAVVRGLRQKGYRVAFVGDGINDSPALAYADVSVSLRHGADVARETADVLLMERGLAALPDAMAIAQHGMRVLRQSVALVAAPNTIALALAVTGRLSPVAATIINNGSTIVAGLHALSPLLRRPTASVPSERVA